MSYCTLNTILYKLSLLIFARYQFGLKTTGHRSSGPISNINIHTSSSVADVDTVDNRIIVLCLGFNLVSL